MLKKVLNARHNGISSARIAVRVCAESVRRLAWSSTHLNDSEKDAQNGPQLAASVHLASYDRFSGHTMEQAQYRSHYFVASFVRSICFSCVRFANFRSANSPPQRLVLKLYRRATLQAARCEPSTLGVSCRKMINCIVTFKFPKV